MNTCTDHTGAVVVHDGRDCPLCEIQAAVSEVRSAAGDIDSGIDDIEAEISKLDTDDSKPDVGGLRNFYRALDRALDRAEAV